MFTNTLKLACLVWFLGLNASEARMVPPWPFKELEPKAALICNGNVESVSRSAFLTNFHYPEVTPSDPREYVMTAKVRLLQVFKGNAPAEIIISHRASDPSEQVFGGAAMHIWLQEGQRYHFFLKPGPDPGKYVGVLEGNFDDGFAVEKLWPNERDDSPFLRKEDIIKIAHDYTASKKPELRVDWSHASVYGSGELEGAAWSVSFLYPAVHPVAVLQIIVRGDRTVDPTRTKLKVD